MSITPYSTEILQAAIEGFEQQKLRIDSRIAELRAIIAGDNNHQTEQAAPPARRQFSAEAKQRMREAQQRRWDTSRGKGEAPAIPAKKSKAKRKLSSAGRAAIVEALKKRWAAKKADSGKASLSKRPSKKVT